MSLAEKLIVKPGSKVRLSDIDPGSSPGVKQKADAADRLDNNIKRLSVLQYLLYAENKQSLLIVLQGIDAGGKDGTVKHVMTGLNPQSCQVTSFKVPEGDEKYHDYLWRIHKAVPRQGHMGIFNRSHYEDVLVVRVHNLVPKSVWKKRYDQINDFERMLSENGTHILKFFLYISKDEQKKRFEERLKDPEKNWKFSPGDVDERRFWDDYMQAFEEAMTRCSTDHAPWYVIPANKKWYRNLAVSDIIRHKLESLDMKFPAPQFDLSQIKFE